MKETFPSLFLICVGKNKIKKNFLLLFEKVVQGIYQKSIFNKIKNHHLKDKMMVVSKA